MFRPYRPICSALIVNLRPKVEYGCFSFYDEDCENEIPVIRNVVTYQLNYKTDLQTMFLG